MIFEVVVGVARETPVALGLPVDRQPRLEWPKRGHEHTTSRKQYERTESALLVETRRWHDEHVTEASLISSRSCAMCLLITLSAC